MSVRTRPRTYVSYSLYLRYVVLVGSDTTGIKKNYVLLPTTTYYYILLHTTTYYYRYLLLPTTTYYYALLRHTTTYYTGALLPVRAVGCSAVVVS